MELVVNPGRLAGWGVRQGDSDGLGLRALKVICSSYFAGVEGDGVQGVLFFGRQRVVYLCGQCVLGVQVNPEKTLRPHRTEGGGYDGTPVTALGSPVLIAKTLHEFHPCGCDTRNSPPRLGRLSGKPESRQGRDDDVEGIFDVSAECHRISERANEFQELDDRTWPSVRQDEGHRIRILGLDMNEVNVQSIDRGQELGETIEF